MLAPAPTVGAPPGRGTRPIACPRTYPPAMPLVLIGLGGFAGAISRYLVDGVVSDRTGGAFPWGTLAVNATGHSCSGCCSR